jgi:hypothetical protein
MVHDKRAKKINAVKRYVRGLFILFCFLAAAGPCLQFFNIVGIRRFTNTFTKYGPLPEIRIPIIEWILFALAITLLVAAILELLRFRKAPLVALLDSALLWIYFVPGLWARIVGDGFFQPIGSYPISVPWAWFIFHAMATLSAIMLTHIRNTESVISMPGENKMRIDQNEKAIL